MEALELIGPSDRQAVADTARDKWSRFPKELPSTSELILVYFWYCLERLVTDCHKGEHDGKR